MAKYVRSLVSIVRALGFDVGENYACALAQTKC